MKRLDEPQRRNVIRVAGFTPMRHRGWCRAATS